ncbi:MAG: UDP-3-O-[3-hydroxymyristoyl] glucosamine N-acyltransferase [Arenicella sp.]|jgi:UDP-3-O-[3-hydroxymyristoyl] glucosamine N-acyltransferase
MVYHVNDVLSRFSDLIVEAKGADASFSRIDAVDAYQSDSLIFISDAAASLALNNAMDSSNSAPAVVVTNVDVATSIDNHCLCVITVKNVRFAQAVIKQAYADYDSADSHWGMIHPGALIHPSAKLAKGVRVGPNTVIGPDVEIGTDTHIRSNCVIEHSVMIGENCVINNLVNIGYLSVVGNRVIIRSGAIIGNEGFGFGQDQHGRYHRTPHTGIVEIGDDVQIGANCNIDRGTYGATKIAKGVKIDALCHIAHNVNIDEDALFVAQSGVAGSCNIGKRVIASGQTGMLDHKTVVDDAILVHRCGVTEDVLEPGMWAGTPPRPFKEYVRNLNMGKSMSKKVTKLENELRELKKIMAA